MFTIIFENKNMKQFNSDYYFDTLEEAYEYLKEEGYSNNNRIFIKTTDWGGNQKAFVKPLKRYNKAENNDIGNWEDFHYSFADSRFED